MILRSVVLFVASLPLPFCPVLLVLLHGYGLLCNGEFPAFFFCVFVLEVVANFID